MPPVNDNFASATVLSGASGTVTFSNVGATLETDEPANAEGHSVWFKWVPTVSADVFVKTSTTPLPDWDSLIYVFTGTSYADLTVVTSADDNDYQPGHSDPYGTSQATWTAVAGTTYWIQVTAYDDVSGPVERSDLKLAYGLVPPPGPTISSATSINFSAVGGTFAYAVDGHSWMQGEATTFWNNKGPAGATVKILGTHLSGVVAVRFGTGTAASFTIVSSTEIHAVVPANTETSTTLVVADTYGQSATATYTKLFWDTWEQQPDDGYIDVVTTATSVPAAQYNSVVDRTGGAGSPLYDGTTAFTHGSSGQIALETDEAWIYFSSPNTTSWSRRIYVGGLHLDVLQPGNTSPPERFDSGFAGWQWEPYNQFASWLFPFTIRATFHVGNMGFIDDDPKDPDSPPDVMQGTLQLRRVPNSAYTVDSGFDIIKSPDVWPTAAELTSWELLAEVDLLDQKTVSVADFNPGLIQAFPVDGATDVVFEFTFTEADLDAGKAIGLVACISRWADDILLEETTAGSNRGKGNENANGPFVGTITPRYTIGWRPPRYRVLYTVPPIVPLAPSPAHPLRKPPSQRNKEFTKYRAHRAARSMVPGTMGGRVANAAIVRKNEDSTIQDVVSAHQFGSDSFTVAATPVYTYQTSYQPAPSSLLVAVNGLVLREGTDYTVDYAGGEFTISTTLHADDLIETRYATR